MNSAPRMPAGFELFLRRGEWRSPGGAVDTEPVIVRVVEAAEDVERGTVAVVGHECHPDRSPCGRSHCWEGHVNVVAILAELKAAS